MSDIIAGVEYLSEEGFDQIIAEVKEEMVGGKSVARQKLDLIVKLHNEALDRLEQDDCMGFLAHLIVLWDLVGPMAKFVESFAQHLSAYMAKRDGVEAFAAEAATRIARIRQTHSYLQKKGGEREEDVTEEIRAGMVRAFRSVQKEADEKVKFQATIDRLAKEAIDTGVLPSSDEIMKAVGLDKLEAEAKAELKKRRDEKKGEEKEERQYIYRDIEV